MQVVLAARGYPGSYEKGSVIGNLEAIREAKVSQLSHSARNNKPSLTFSSPCSKMLCWLADIQTGYSCHYPARAF